MGILSPKKLKHRKWQKGRSKGVARRGSDLSFGSYGLKSLESKWITAFQLEAARRAITRRTKQKGKLWIRIFHHKPITKKGTEVPMGGGKGNVEGYVFPIRPGRVIFEIEGVEESIAKAAFKMAADKLPIKTKFIKK